MTISPKQIYNSDKIQGPWFPWIGSAVLVAFVLFWPVLGGIVSCEDDLDHSRASVMRGTVCDNFVYWWHTWQFRPLDDISYLFVNADTLDSRATMLLQLPALVAILWIFWAALKRLTPDYRVYFPWAVIFWCLHVSTMVSLWQHDTIAQTWSAAAGAWISILTWDAIEFARSGLPLRRQCSLLAFACILGVLTKETFLGWVAALDCLLAVLAFRELLRGNRRLLLSYVGIAIAVTTIPIVYCAIRSAAGGLGSVAAAGSGRYNAHFGSNFALNIVLSMAGYFSFGPTHILRDSAASVVLRSLSIAAIGLSMLICIAPWAISKVSGRRWPGQPRGEVVLAIAFVSFLGCSATLPMKRVSELYLMGSNIGSAILVAIGLVGWRRLLQQSDNGGAGFAAGRRLLGKAAPIVAGAALILVGLYGDASRTYHFQKTWAYASRLNQIIVDWQKSLPQNTNRVAMIYILPTCNNGFMHNQYLCPPGKSLEGATQPLDAWYNFRDPTRKIKILWRSPDHPFGRNDCIITPKQFPPRKDW